MNVEQLADKLRQMRAAGAAGNTDVMTRLFGVIFCEEIAETGNNASAIVAAYRRRQSVEGPEKWPGSPTDTVIQDGRKLAQFVDPHDHVVRKWK